MSEDDGDIKVWIDGAQYIPDYYHPETGATFDLKYEKGMEIGSSQHGIYTLAAGLTKPKKRIMKKSRDNEGCLWELHPTKGWRKVRKENV